MTQYVWPEWQGKSLEDILLLCRELVEDPTFPTARRWHAAGGKVVGHFQVYCPEEIIHAAGLLPLKIHGAPMEPVQADSRFGSYLCAILKTSLELALSRRLELDMFITPPICDAARNLAAVWGRNVAYPCQILYLPQNANSAYAVHYLRDEYARLARHLEALAGHAITAADLRHALAVFNENRALLRELYTIKRDTPWLLAVDEAYVCMAMGGLLRRDEHNALLRTVLPLIAQRPARRQDKIRVVFEGGFCEQPPPGHAAYHCAVVLCGGRRPADRPALDCQRCAAGRRCALQSGPGLSGSLVVQPGAA